MSYIKNKNLANNLLHPQGVTRLEIVLATLGNGSGGGGGVSSVAGTSNRISSTGGATPVLDISSNYIGQSSITTLGTINTGTWNATVISPSKGGTGVANIGTLTLGDDNIVINTSGPTTLTLPLSGTLSTIEDVNKIDVFLIAGQSNAVGQGDSSLSPTPTAGTAFQFYSGTISAAVDPIGNANTGSAWPSFAVKYYNMTGRKICFVPAAMGGSSMSPGGQSANFRWDTGGNLYGTSVTRLNDALVALAAAGYSPEVKGILWCQGEQDGSDINNALSTANDYKSNFTTMLANYRTTYGAHIPMYIFRTGTNTSVSDVGYAAVRQAQEELATTLTDTYIVYRGAIDFDSRGLLIGVVHYTQAGYNEMGTLGAEVAVNKYVSNNPITQYVKTGFGVTSPEAYIDIAANSSTIPNIRFGQSITLLASPLARALEANDSALYYTDSTGTRRQISTISGTETLTNKTLGGNLAFGANDTYSIGSSGNQASAVWAALFRNNGNIQVRTSTASQLIQFMQNTEVARFSATNGNLLIGTTSDASSTDKIQASGNLNLITAGNKIKITTGTNASAGTGSFSGGLTTVSTTAVTASSLIFIQHTSCSSCGTPYIVSKTAGTSFLVQSSNGSDASNFNWWIIN